MQQRVDFLLRHGLAALGHPERAVHAAQHDEIGDRDDEQKQRRRRGSDDAADLAVGHQFRAQRVRGQRHRKRSDHDDGRMPEREEEADRDRPLALLHQLARHIVDRGDMVGIDRMAQPEAIGQHRGADQDRLMRERDEGPDPGGQIAGNEKGVDRNDPCPKTEQFGFGVPPEESDFTSAAIVASFARDISIDVTTAKGRPMHAHRMPEG